MVGFLQTPATEGAVKEDKEDISLKPSVPVDPLDLCIPELDDFSFSDSFLDFDTINGWLNPGFPDMAELGGNESAEFASVRDDLKENLGIGDEVKGEIDEKDASLGGLERERGESRVVERSDEMSLEREKGVVERIDELGSEKGVLGREGLNLGCLIEEQLKKVCLEGQLDCSAVGAGEGEAGGVAVVVGNESKIDENGGDEDGSEEESESESESSSAASSSSSSSSSSSDEESEEMSGEKKVDNVEDGEIVLSDAEEMVAWGDDEDVDGDGGEIRPIMSKNEVKDLPPVPPVTVTLEPHHQTLPVGTILSIIGSQVIVEGVDKHSPLTEGSILWITESRLPLGIIDEIFGPVKNPYYIVRYNSETEVPTGIQQGTLVSFVQDFANHILNDKSLYQKGYDASNENDEELSEEMEFSDDEKEAEYKRMLKMKKRGTNESKQGNKRKDKRQVKNQNGNWNKNQDPVTTSLNQENGPSSSGFRQGSAGNQAVAPPFPQRPQAPGFPAPNGVWSNGFPPHHQQNVNLQTGFPANNMPWMQQNLPFQLCQTPLQANAAFQQQMGPIPGLPMNFNAMGGQPNFGGPPMLAPWTIGLDQNALNSLQFGMGLQAQQSFQPINGQSFQPMNGDGEQVTQSPGSHISQNLQQSPAPLNFNQGQGGTGGSGGGGRGGGGRRGNHRGRGRFGGGRGRHS